MTLLYLLLGAAAAWLVYELMGRQPEASEAAIMDTVPHRDAGFDLQPSESTEKNEDAGASLASERSALAVTVSKLRVTPGK